MNPQSLNRYGYVLNNPTNFTDPLGLFTDAVGSGCQDFYYAVTHAECREIPPPPGWRPPGFPIPRPRPRGRPGGNDGDRGGGGNGTAPAPEGTLEPGYGPFGSPEFCGPFGCLPLTEGPVGYLHPLIRWVILNWEKIWFWIQTADLTRQLWDQYLKKVWEELQEDIEKAGRGFQRNYWERVLENIEEAKRKGTWEEAPQPQLQVPGRR